MDDILASIRRAVTEGPLPEETTSAASPVAQTRAPLPDPATSLDAHMHALLEPALKAWLDANLPEIVDRAVEAELARLTGQLG